MKINIKARNLEITPSLEIYIEKKLNPLSKLIKKFETLGEVKGEIEIARLTKHHKKGKVFSAKADLILPHKFLRAEARGGDIREAVDILKDKLFMETEKYKEKILIKR